MLVIIDETQSGFNLSMFVQVEIPESFIFKGMISELAAPLLDPGVITERTQANLYLCLCFKTLSIKLHDIVS